MNRYPSGTRPRPVQTGRGGMPVKPAPAPAVDASVLIPLPLAMAYVPMQVWGETYSCEKALQQGTLFPILDLPFCRGGDGA